jgi:antitoxin (DNA-binding transcriptional repressor) of toxin-antitoxin stability system
MSDKGGFIEVEVTELSRELLELVRQIRRNGRRVRIVERGEPLADLTPTPETSQQVDLPLYRELGPIQFNIDPTSPVPEEDWPESAR